MTVGELIEKLENYDKDLPVLTNLDGDFYDLEKSDVFNAKCEKRNGSLGYLVTPGDSDLFKNEYTKDWKECIVI